MTNNPDVAECRDDRAPSVDFVNVVCAVGPEVLRLTVQNGHGGTIHGFNRLGEDPFERNTPAFGATEFWATDGTTSAFVAGAQLTYNPDVTPEGQPGDRLLAGGFEMWMRGPIQNFVTNTTRQGTLHCTTREPALQNSVLPFGVSPSYFESVLNLVPEDPAENS